MRKMLCLLLCLGLIFALTACNSARSEPNPEAGAPGENVESTNSPVSTEGEVSSLVDIPSSGSEPIEITAQLPVSPTESAPAPATRPATPLAALPTQSALAETVNNDKESEGMLSINITAGSAKFAAILNNNETTQALAAQIPLTVRMNELNRQEKYFHLSENLPAASTECPATIHAGDIMCWSGNNPVLFYTTYANSYGGYVLLGTVDNPSGLEAALGSGNVQVTWSVVDK